MSSHPFKVDGYLGTRIPCIKLVCLFSLCPVISFSLPGDYTCLACCAGKELTVSSLPSKHVPRWRHLILAVNFLVLSLTRCTVLGILVQYMCVELGCIPTSKLST